jgi:Domain of Unknown Function (DUF748)
VLKPAPAAVRANATPADNASQASEVPVRIDTVTLQGGKVNFSDQYIKPNYSASLVEIGGRVSGLSSEESRLADIDLRGKLENSAPLEIVGNQSAGERSLPRSQGGFPGYGPVALIPLLRTVRRVRN